MDLGKLPTLIAFAGLARSGKDTAAQVAMRTIPNTTLLSFADPIRAAIKAMFGIDMYDDYWIERKEEVVPWIGKSPRQLMQTLGTEWGRTHVHEEIWVRTLARRAAIEYAKGQDYVVICDLRFPNEHEWLRSVGARIVHLRRPSNVVVTNGHESEQNLPRKEGEYLIVNDFPTRESFQKKIASVLNDIQFLQRECVSA